MLSHVLQKEVRETHLALSRHKGLPDAQASVLCQQVSVDQVHSGCGDLLQDALDHHGPQQPRIKVICTDTGKSYNLHLCLASDILHFIIKGAVQLWRWLVLCQR